MLTKEMIRQVALAAGADDVGFGDLRRFDDSNCPPDKDPRYINPRANTLIGFTIRIPRGVQRGIEEGTQFSQYPSLAYGGINESYMPAVLYEVGRLIEDHGYEATVYRNTGSRGKINDVTGLDDGGKSPPVNIERTADKTPHHRTIGYTRPVREDTRAPDVQFHFRIAAVICGLGEIGWSRLFLSPRFGPMVRLAYLLTDAPLEPDPLYSGPPLCNKCMACANMCPGKCITTDKTKAHRLVIEGKTVEWGHYDGWKCYAFYTYPGRKNDPFIPIEIFENNPEALRLIEGAPVDATEEEILQVYDKLDEFFPSWVGYNTAKCGGCMASCTSMLERRGGCLENRFVEPFRKKRRWQLDR